MKFLLAALNAKYIHSNPALYSLRAYAAQYKDYIALSEFTINNDPDDILADIYRQKPDVIGFSCYIWNISQILELTKELRKVLPGTHIWLGGPEVTYDGNHILMEHPEIAGIMIGEGEVTFLELLAAYVFAEQKGEAVSFKNISGLLLRDGATKSRELTDINSLPFLYNNLEQFTNKIIYYESSRGCPFRCSYCLSSIDKMVRLRNLDIVKKELAHFLKNKTTQVKFVDRTFNCNHTHAMEIWKYIKENDNGITNFHFEVAADILREDEIQILSEMRPGAVQLEIGVQSTNAQTIKEIDRVMNVEKLAYIVSEIRKSNNIHVHLDLIAGLPYEDYESFKRSFNEVYAMKPQQLQLGFLKVLKGSKMHENAERYGIVYTDKPPYEVLYTKWISYEEILKLKQVESMVELYYNSNQFTTIFPILEKQFETPFALFLALAKYYEREGFFLNSPSRTYRYEVLLQFAKIETDLGTTHPGFLEELLVMDVYLRENVKNRPVFAKSILDEKDVIRGFYRQEEEKRTYLKEYESFDAKQMAKMTHVEPFVYDLKTGDKNTVKQYVLFDYKHRSLLTHDARTFWINIE